MFIYITSIFLSLLVISPQAETVSGNQQDSFSTNPDSLEIIEGLLPQFSTVNSDTVFEENGIKAGWERGSFFLSSRDDEYRLTIGGRIQSRYEYLDRPFDENLSSFYLRRVRLDLRGEFMGGKITWRIMPEMARTASLRDGWINYEISSGVNLRAGQFVVPFQWLRFISGNRQHFAERGSASEDFFGNPGGYDIGIGVHGRNEENTITYGIGLFDGSGRNVRESNSAGHMASGRITWAALGVIPREEPDLSHSENINLTFGAGLQAANRNEIRDWSLGQSATNNRRGNWVAGTADIALQWQGLSVIPTGYIRKVNPDETTVESYTGWGQVVSAGYFIIPKSVELVTRVSRVMNNRDDVTTRQTDWGAGVNVYHFGHRLKTQVNYENLDREVSGTEHVLRVQLHMQF